MQHVYQQITIKRFKQHTDNIVIASSCYRALRNYMPYIEIYYNYTYMNYYYYLSNIIITTKN